MGVEVGAMEVMLVRALAVIMILALVLVMVGQACMVVEQVTVAVVATILMQGRY